MKTLQEVLHEFKTDLAPDFSKQELDQMTSILFEQAFHISRLDMVINSKLPFSNNDYARLNEIKDELKSGKPLAHVLGDWEFFGLPIGVNEYTLIPRPETEELVKLILEDYQNKPFSLLDIGTGSGCIPIAVKKLRPEFSVYGIDISKKALRKAAENALLNEVEVELEVYDILRGKQLKHDVEFDVIVSNPPYIPIRERENMDRSVVEFEPDIALFIEDSEPLVFYDAVAEYALVNLKSGGKIYFETHHEYAKQVAELLKGKGFIGVQVVEDINDKERMVSAQLIN